MITKTGVKSIHQSVDEFRIPVTKFWRRVPSYLLNTTESVAVLLLISAGSDATRSAPPRGFS